jgi:hypothetical protein
MYIMLSRTNRLVDDIRVTCPYCGFSFPEDMMYKVPDDEPFSEKILTMCSGCYLTGGYKDDHQSQ